MKYLNDHDPNSRFNLYYYSHLHYWNHMACSVLLTFVLQPSEKLESWCGWSTNGEVSSGLHDDKLAKTLTVTS